MDARLFDRLVQSLAEHGTRRGALGWLTSLPIVGGLVSLLGDEGVEAAGRWRRKKRHKHGKGRRKKKAQEMQSAFARQDLCREMRDRQE